MITKNTFADMIVALCDWLGATDEEQLLTVLQRLPIEVLWADSPLRAYEEVTAALVTMLEDALTMAKSHGGVSMTEAEVRSALTELAKVVGSARPEQLDAMVNVALLRQSGGDVSHEDLAAVGPVFMPIVDAMIAYDVAALDAEAGTTPE